jgi:hypothetical protein
MKAFLTAIVAMVIIAAGAYQILEVINVSTAKAGTSSENVRRSE